MNLAEIIKRAEKFTVDNSPVILTAIGVTGSLTTAYLTGKATFKAAELIQETKGRDEDLWMPADDKAKLIWKLYIPAASTAAITVIAIVGANRIGTRRAAAVAAAYTISEKAFVEYKEKVVEKLGEKKEQSVRDEIQQDRVKRRPVDENTVIVTGGGEVLCFDHFTGRYFKSDMESLKKAQNDLNYRILHHSYASLSDFYERIGLPATSFSEEVGWSSDQQLELLFSTCLSQDGRPCIAIDFDVSPIRGYHRCHVE